MKKDSDLARRALILTIAAICFLLAIFAIRWSIGDVQAYSAKFAVKQWQQQKRIPREDELSVAMSSIQSALEWEPENPTYLARQGLLYYYSALRLQKNPTEFNQQLSLAAKSYQLSVENRPKWPYSWANLALMKAHLMQFDSVYANALIKATTYGPWENDVHIIVTEAGLKGWNALDKQLRQIIISNIQRGIRRSSSRILHSVEKNHKKSVVCAFLSRDKYQEKFCAK